LREHPADLRRIHVRVSFYHLCCLFLCV